MWSKPQNDNMQISFFDKLIRGVLGQENWPTLLGGGSRFLLWSAGRVPDDNREFPVAVGLLGSALPLGTRLFPLEAILGRVSLILTGLEVPRRVLPPDIPLDFCSRFWKVGGSWFMGLSWTQKVSLLIGLSESAGLNMPSLADVSTSNFSTSSGTLEAAVRSFPTGSERVLSRWLTKTWASLQISSKFSSSSGLQLGSSPKDGPLLKLSFVWVSTPWETHLSLCVTEPKKTSSSTSSPSELKQQQKFQKAPWMYARDNISRDSRVLFQKPELIFGSDLTFQSNPLGLQYNDTHCAISPPIRFSWFIKT